uniref:Uncharacterized protein n=1 Tax=Candidatus Kentrum sp. FW TaxID=2126338 RepID=A0A450T4X4_9GAMM|nr:MAG: hypothetical protein BECKFW1821B_GA0114236_106717 [Candidatus Kentron sp. FW]
MTGDVTSGSVSALGVALRGDSTLIMLAAGELIANG